MPIYENILDTIGRTTVVKLHNIAPKNVDLYVKVEFFNPGGSVKDCLALVLGTKTDTLFPIMQQQKIANMLSNFGTKVIFQDINTPQGHDSFLVEIEKFGTPIHRFLSEIEI